MFCENQDFRECPFYQARSQGEDEGCIFYGENIRHATELLGEYYTDGCLSEGWVDEAVIEGELG